MNVDTLQVYGEALLANIAADLAAAALPAPARQFFSHGPPPRDCDQLAVWWQGITPSFGGRTLGAGAAQETAPRHATPVVSWGVELSMCPPVVPSPRPPHAIEMRDAARLGARYGWALYRALTGRWVAGTLFAPYAGRAGQAMAPTVQPPTVDGALLVLVASFSYNHMEEPP